jgi:hypothetical protein
MSLASDGSRIRKGLQIAHRHLRILIATTTEFSFADFPTLDPCFRDAPDRNFG